MTPLDWKYATVAITGMNNRPDNPGPGYGVARCLRETPGFAGRIIGLGYDALDGGLYHGGICDAAYLLPYPSTGEASLMARLNELIDAEDITVLIPCLDAELGALCRLQSPLQKRGVRLLLPDPQQLKARAKDQLPALCARAGVSTPDLTCISSASFFDNCEEKNWSFPLVVKGPFYDAKIVHDITEAKAAFAQIASQWGLPILVQRFHQGEEFNVMAVGRGDGSVAGLVMMRKQALTEKGKAWAGITIECEALESAAHALIRELRWPGPLEVEMLRDQDGSFQLIEINPRFPAWVYLSHGAGCNLPHTLLRTLFAEEFTAPSAKAGTLFIRYAEELIVDLCNFESVVMTGRLIPPLPYVA